MRGFLLIGFQAWIAGLMHNHCARKQTVACHKVLNQVQDDRVVIRHCGLDPQSVRKKENG
jgi:hypothetical protein